MKILLLIMISFSAFGSYIPEDIVSDCTKSKISFPRINICESITGKRCLKADKSWNCAIDKVKPDTQLKEQSLACTDESDCISKFKNLECETDFFYKVRTAENDEVYCTKFEPAHVVADEALKANLDEKQLKKANRAIRKARGAAARQKCKDALDYIAGGNLDSELTEEQVDGMQAAFSSIFQALQANRPGKALRLIKLVTDPAYDELKNNIIEILE